MGLRGTALDLHMELLRKRISRRRVGVWGHIGSYVKPPNALDLAIERRQMLSSDHIFAYTTQGAELAISRGIPSQKVTAVMNSTDVSDLMNAYTQLTDGDVQDFFGRHLLLPGKTFGFIGGLDASKRIEFLVEVLDEVWNRDLEIKVLVVGRGEQQELLSRAVSRGQVVLLGYGGPLEKALVLRASQALVCPGRIGLVAVECLATGVPLLTTDWRFHAPEYNYLEVGSDVLVSRNDVCNFVSLMLSYVNSGRILSEHVGKQYPTVEEMVRNFASGVEEMFT
jgi:glycosyltransferase involved in cell wall biosynthesis